MEKKKAWYNEKLKREQAETHQVEVRLNNEMGRLEERHLKESKIWAEMKNHYEEAVMTNKQGIVKLKNVLQEAQNRSQAITENVRIVLQTNREKFSVQLKTALDKGWMAWVTQAAELHTYRADWENRIKEGRGFYKLNEESIVTVRDDLAQDYRALAEQLFQQLAQMLDDFGESQEEIFCCLMEIRQYLIPPSKLNLNLIHRKGQQCQVTMQTTRTRPLNLPRVRRRKSQPQ